jgi:hypothetical protein
MSNKMFDAEYFLGVGKVLLFFALLWCMNKGYTRTLWILVTVMLVIAMTEPRGGGQYGLHYDD